MEQAAEGICLLDADTKEVIECNAALQRLLGSATPNAFAINGETSERRATLAT